MPTRRTSRPTTPRDDLRRGFGLDRFVIVYAGAHGPANGLDLVLDAAADVRTDCPDVRFLLIGDGVAKAALMARAEQEGLGNVEFRAPMAKNEIRPLLTAVDAGVHVLADVPLFRYGVSPNKLFDYMAAGIPVITNTPGEVQELVAEAGAGLAVAPERPGRRGAGDGRRRAREAGGVGSVGPNVHRHPSVTWRPGQPARGPARPRGRDVARPGRPSGDPPEALQALVIVGAGGHGRETLDIVEAVNRRSAHVRLPRVPRRRPAGRRPPGPAGIVPARPRRGRPSTPTPPMSSL